MANSFVRNSVVNAVAGLFTTLGSFFGTILVARLLGVGGTGIVAYATWTVTIAVIVSDLGLAGCLQRFLPELLARGEEETAARLTHWLYRVFGGCGASVTFCFLLYAAWAAWRNPAALGWSVVVANLELSPLFWVLVGLTAFIQGLGNFANSWLKGLQDFGMLARAALANCLVQVVATALGASLFGVAGALVAMSFGGLVPALMLLRLPRARGAISDALRRRVRRFSLETGASFVLTAFFASRMEVFFLERSWGNHAVGLFTVSVTLSNLATQGPLLLTGALLPRLSGHVGREEAAEARQIYATSISLMGLLVFPACLGMAAVAPVLLPLMYGRDFTAAVHTTAILLTASALVATASVATVYLFAMERTRFLLGTAVVGAALSILAGLTVVPAFGPVAAACGRGGIQVAIAGASLCYMHRRLGCPTPVGVLTRLLAAAGFCAAFARLIVVALPTGMGILLAVLVGALVYAGAIRALRPLALRDVNKLRAVVANLPPMLRPAAHAGMQLIWP